MSGRSGPKCWSHPHSHRSIMAKSYLTTGMNMKNWNHMFYSQLSSVKTDFLISHFDGIRPAVRRRNIPANVFQMHLIAFRHLINR